MRSLLIVVLITITGCDYCPTACQSRKMTCNADQLEMIRKEMELCGSTGYPDTYCYDVAKLSHCTLREKES